MSDKQPLPTDLELTALDPVFREHPHDRLDRLRAEDPVHLDAELGRLGWIARFWLARKLATTPAMAFRSRTTLTAPAAGNLRRTPV